MEKRMRQIKIQRRATWERMRMQGRFQIQDGTDSLNLLELRRKTEVRSTME